MQFDINKVEITPKKMSCALRQSGESSEVRDGVIEHRGLKVDESVLAKDLEIQGQTKSQCEKFREMIRGVDPNIL